MAAKQAPRTAKSKRVFGQLQAAAKMFRVGLYARVSTHDQKTLPMQMRAMREYAAKRGWEIAVQIKEVGSGAVERELREKVMAAARRREIDVVLVWRLDRWGRSLADLVVTLKELSELGVGFVSLTEALDLTTPPGRAMAGLLSVFAEFEHEILRERIRAGLVEARRKGEASRPARDCWETGQPDPKAASRRRQQSRDRPPSRYRSHFRAPNPGRPIAGRNRSGKKRANWSEGGSRCQIRTSINCCEQRLNTPGCFDFSTKTNFASSSRTTMANTTGLSSS